MKKSKKDVNIHRGLVSALHRKDEALQKYAHITSHILRAPVASILGLAHLWQIHKDDPVFRETIVEKVLESAVKLDQITSTLNAELVTHMNANATQGKERHQY